ncbi:MAG: inositol monophosphatase family protein [Marinosulfonomonas sp.]
MSDAETLDRYEAAKNIATKAGAEALRYFETFDTLTIDQKGHQDLVSEGDRNVELLVRAELGAAFPDDGIVGEEHANVDGTSGYVWVIDPIDGTANFVRGIPAWCVTLACVKGDEVLVGVIFDPVHDELYHTTLGQGAFCNDAKISTVQNASLSNGSIAIGFSGRTRKEGVLSLIEMIVNEGGVFYRNASGALSLAYVSCGKLLGYVEEHMHPWDCLAGQLLVAEAGGMIEQQDAQSMVAKGGRVVAGAQGIAQDLLRMADAVYKT